MQIGIASPQKIRYWSFGEVKKPETINYRTQKPEREGLFDERIFGPQKDWECACGKLKGVFYKNQVCEVCGVQVTTAKSRRERMGHIELAAPTSHIWYFKGIPSRMGLALDMSPRALEEIIYFASYVVTDPKETDLEKKQLLTEREYREQLLKNGFGSFVAKMGAEAIQDLLNDVDLDKEIAELKEELKVISGQRRVKVIRRLDVLSAFRKSGNRLEWMVLNVLPVIPPDLRPMVQLDGGRFATSDLNDLYRRVINRNNRLKRLMELNAPNIIVQNEKRMLQEAVDTLIDNGRRGRPITGASNRPLKSLSHMLKGKQGRFRQNLLGKRVDYSGRSVIAVGPTLKTYQMGLPREMAIELFKPFVMSELVKRELAANIRAAKRKVERQDFEVWDVLEDVVKEHPVLLNRAPTLHRLGIQAYEPVLIDGKAMRLHPLACEAFNADFDGDQMAIHLPLSEEAQAEARLLMLGAEHILNPKDGKPVVTPSQDMVLGNYYITMEQKHREGEGMIFASPEEVEIARTNGIVHLHSRVGILASALDRPWTQDQKDKILVTTVGKILFNNIIPSLMPFINEPTDANLTTQTEDRFFMTSGEDIHEFLENLPTVLPFKKKYLGKIIAEVFKRYGTTATSMFLDELKNLGYHQSTLAGLTVGIADIPTVDKKPEIIEAAHEKVAQITKQFRRGLITDDERYTHVCDVWRDAKEALEKELIAHQDISNPIVMMMDSGARGNISNFSQLSGMRGLMAAPNGKTMELPVISNFREGLTVQEMFFSTHGARKGMTDTALKTAESGYLTRRLVDVAQDVIIREEDCGTDRGLLVKEIANGKEMIEPLFERLVGRYTKKTVVNPETGETIIGENQLITEEVANQIIDAGVEEVTIRSIFTCKTPHGVCKHCYGMDMATGGIVEVGEAVGIVAAQAIGEPGTQLTMRNFHFGGVAGNADITQGLPRVQEIFEARNPKGEATITEVTGVVQAFVEDAATRTREITIKGETDTRSYVVPMSSPLMVEEGEFIHRGAPLVQGSIEPKHLLQVRDALSVETYLLAEVQKTYRGQGVEIGDKHIEVMVRQMLRKIRVMDNGSTDVLPGSLIEIDDFEKINETALLNGEMPATGRPVLMGITKASLETNSFLSAASFQETTRVLTDAAIRGKEDHLLGLKENVIIGKIIPAGTGMARYRNLEPLSDLTNAPEIVKPEPVVVVETVKK
ncbi:DNA-directed RNA polymerase subunit beta' [Lactococcus hircilactis]|uniref:DNA-directed RNA polymerase subunit beta' n=2 Tax=Lactococcus hircilactis TaxID=1494462 RepID=A0A7X1Z7V8_9LACT|nr:DNA-directed RNA polymerase subunit beta' [Lactococcus hircilactis]